MYKTKERTQNKTTIIYCSPRGNGNMSNMSIMSTNGTYLMLYQNYNKDY